MVLYPTLHSNTDTDNFCATFHDGSRFRRNTSEERSPKIIERQCSRAHNIEWPALTLMHQIYTTVRLLPLPDHMAGSMDRVHSPAGISKHSLLSAILWVEKRFYFSKNSQKGGNPQTTTFKNHHTEPVLPRLPRGGRALLSIFRPCMW